jgi:hypothetical protein
MVASQARVDANRRNAQKSTGPKTPAGLEKSRANAIKHGLCSLTVIVESEELIRERTEAFIAQFKPEGEYLLLLAGQAALASIRIERCQRMERGVRDKVSLRAEICWGDVERLDAICLGGSIAKAPEFVVEQLRQTLQGCEWLLGRWGLLANAAGSKTGWTPEQASLAFDLLGTPLEFRSGFKPGDPLAVARRMVDELVSRRDLLAGLDEAKQALAWADLDDEADPELKRLRRYEASLHRRLRWCIDQLENPEKPEGSPPEPKAVTISRVEPPPEPEPEPVKPPEEAPSPSRSPEIEALIAAGRFSSIDLPYEIKPFGLPTLDQFVDHPSTSGIRIERKLQKADKRREARRRKLEKSRS